MSVDHTHFLNSARAMASGGEEMDMRNSISRSYYGVFHRARLAASYCPSIEHLDFGVGVHQKLIEQYKSFDNASPLASKAKSVAYTLQHLKAARVKADYQITDTVTNADLDSHLDYVDLAMERLNQFESQAALAAA